MPEISLLYWMDYKCKHSFTFAPTEQEWEKCERSLIGTW